MILVTGGTGFIGSHLLFQLVQQDQQVRALKRPSSSLDLVNRVFGYYSDRPKGLLDKIQWVEGDLNDYESVVSALDGVQFVYHAGAVVSFHSNDRAEIIKTNIEGTANIVNACLEQKVEKLLFVSSIGALGRAVAKGLVDEETHFQTSNKNSLYSTAKFEAEKEVWRGLAEGLDAVIVNPAIVIGPGNWDRGSSQVFQTMFDGLKYYSVGMNGFIDVKDVARIMILLMNGNHSGERFILSTENISYKQFFEWMAASMEIPAPKIKAGPLLSSIGWRYLKFRSFFTGKRSGITKETAKTANQVYQYNNAKLLGIIDFDLIPVRQSVQDTTRLFLMDRESQ
jgi:nucleoside-diphosphate-sugar epimerase